MKAASAGHITTLAGRSMNYVQCCQIIRRDGEIFTFTEHDLPLSIDIGDGEGTLVYAANPGFSPTERTSANEMRPDQTEPVFLIKDGSITESDILGEKFQFASVRIFEVDFTNLANGIIKDGRYRIGKQTLQGKLAMFEFRSIADQLNQNIGELLLPSCPRVLGDTKCGVQLDPPTWRAHLVSEERITKEGKAPNSDSIEPINTVKPTVQNGYYYRAENAGVGGSSEPAWQLGVDSITPDGSISWRAMRAYQQAAVVTTVTSNRRFTVANVNDPTGESIVEFWWGTIYWLTGLNAGQKRALIDDDGAGALVLRELAPYNIQVGDTLTVEVLCDHLHTTCRDRFDNLNNFRGFPYIPSPKTAFALGF